MRIRLTDHIRARIVLRGFDASTPERIVRDARERFRDTATGSLIAVAKADVYGKVRDVMVAYRESGDDVMLLTIHPLKPEEKAARVASGRWIAQ